MSATTAKATPRHVAYRVRVAGHVQGVGFRPFVKRLADELGLSGGVGNDCDGVFIDAAGDSEQLSTFLDRLRLEAPPAARIESLDVETSDGVDDRSFEIAPSPRGAGARRARVPRDLAVCGECWKESHDPVDRRHTYAFTSCTVCGPRYTVVETMPYERAGTSMAGFPLCSRCAAEFGDPSDRRFHAEVMACPRCGPRVAFRNFRTRAHVDEEALGGAAAALVRGDIVAIKGLGGFQLLVRADDEAAVSRLRLRKQRPSKPFAVMVRSIADAQQYGHLNSFERDILASPENPIVLVSRRHDAKLSSEIAPHLNQVGLLLPTTPLHHLLLDRVPFPVVATSGNRREEPILADDATEQDLAELADAVLTHDRPIVRRIDDSVVCVMSGRPSVLRLARGFAPLPLDALERWIDRLGDRPAGGVMALGGQQKNSLALWTGTQAILGPHLGDLDSGRSRAAWRRHLADIAELYGTEIRTLIADMHPDYAASRWAEQSGLSFIKVAHHHAHAVAAMVEHGLLDKRVLALTWDGTGLGVDGNLWGGECLRASLTNFERLATLRPLRLPGGEAAIREPWRIAVALLCDAFGDVQNSLWSDVTIQAVGGIVQLLDRQILCPSTTSLGRLFDGVASLLLGVSHVSYEGEAAARLESISDPTIDDTYPVVVEPLDGVMIWDWRATVRAMVTDDSPAPVRAARFHNSVAHWSQIVAEACLENDVVLSGGCFQNALLTDRVSRSLEAIGKRVYRPGLIPVNDGGLAAGQLAIGLARLSNN